MSEGRPPKAEAAPPAGPWTRFQHPSTGVDTSAGPWTRFQQPSADTDAETTVGGVAGSLTRGMAPMAAGAMLGAAAGAPIGGVGAIPGAAAGAGAVGLTELATSLYNPLAKRLGWPQTATPQEMTDRVLDAFGVKRPGTAIERGAEAVSGGAAGALGPARAAGTVAQGATGLTQAIAGRMAERPGLQAVSGALGGAAGQTAAEAGVGPLGQTAASLIGGAAPSAALGSIRADPRQAVMPARQAGYVLPPAAISRRPGVISNVLAGWGGKIKTQQQASDHNQGVTNQLGAQALGLPRDTVLSDQVFENVRLRAGQAYQDVANAIPVITADTTYDNTVIGLGGRSSQAAMLFPRITRNEGIIDLVDELSSVRRFPTSAGLEIVKELRFNGNANLKALGDPSKHALGLAQREAANAIDDLMERNIAATGQTGVIDAYRRARQLIAKSYDLEAVTNEATGDVNARGLARLAARGRPLTEELDTIANTAAAFPKAMQMPAAFGHDEALSGGDFFGSVLAVASGHPGLVGTILGRPVARSTILSEPYQRMMTDPRSAAVPLPWMLDPGMQSIVQPEKGKGALDLR